MIYVCATDCVRGIYATSSLIISQTTNVGVFMVWAEEEKKIIDHVLLMLKEQTIFFFYTDWSSPDLLLNGPPWKVSVLSLFEQFLNYLFFSCSFGP